MTIRASAHRSPRSVTNMDEEWLPEDHAMDVKKAITVNRSPEDLYQFWHDFENLPRFMDHLESVQVTGERRSHWRGEGPGGGGGGGGGGGRGGPPPMAVRPRPPPRGARGQDRGGGVPPPPR